MLGSKGVMVPSASYVSLVYPSFRSAMYTFVPETAYSIRRVAAPMQMGKTPTARGSNVPACPTLVFFGSDCFRRRTVSMDVIPMGLCTFRYPEMLV